MMQTHRSRRSGRHVFLTATALSVLVTPVLAKAADDAAQNDKGIEVVVRAHKNEIANTVKAVSPQVIVTAEDMQRYPDQSVVDALGRMAGISVMKTDSVSPSQGNHNGLDGAARGTGGFVGVRGLSGSYNVNLLNGVNAAQGMPYSRDIELDLLPPVGLKQISVSKTSTADMDGDAIGGTLDFRTPSAFDSKDGYNHLYVQGGFSELAHTYGVPAGSGLAQIETSHRFGNQGQFGIYATAYYGKRNFAGTMEDYQAGQWEYAVSTSEQGPSPDGFNRPDNLLLTSTNAQFSEGWQERSGGALTLDWRVSADTHLYLRATSAHSDIEQSVYQKGIQADGYSAAVVRPDGLYQNAEDQGEYHYWFETAPSISNLSSVVVGGDSQLGHLSANYSLFYSYGSNSAPDHAEITYQTDAANELNGPFQVIYRDHYPIPLLSAAQLSRLNNSSLFNYSQGSGEYTSSGSSSGVSGGQLDLNYQFDNAIFKSLKFGGKYVKRTREAYSRDYSNLDFVPLDSTLATSSLITGQVIADKSHYPYVLPTGNRDMLTQLAAQAAAQVPLSPDDANKNTISGSEGVLSAYVLGRITYAELDIQPGLRLEQTRIRNTYWTQVDPDTGSISYFDANTTDYTQWLPSLHVAYRPTDNAVVRGAVWRSYSRPAFFQLGGGSQISKNSDGTTSITEGNPNLKPMSSTNVDLSSEWFNSSARISAGLFYKGMEHYLYDRGTDFRAHDIQTTGVASISEPLNGGRAKLYGLEIEGELLLTQLQGPLSGLGVNGNLTLQNSQTHLNDSQTDAIMPMQGVARVLYNAGVTYNFGAFDAALTYHYNGRAIVKYRFGAYGGASMNEWAQPIRSLDASFGYRVNKALNLRFAASNLLNAYSYYRTIGQTAEAIPQIVRNGRQYTLSLSYDF